MISKSQNGLGPLYFSVGMTYFESNSLHSILESSNYLLEKPSACHAWLSLEIYNQYAAAAIVVTVLEYEDCSLISIFGRAATAYVLAIARAASIAIAS